MAEKKAEEAPKSRLLSSDAPVADDAADEHPYWVGGKAVTREEYMKALPTAGYVPERMPENFYPPLPAVDSK